ncbi:hypothetical protein PR202_gb19928 [Eleusine coracana subsp. coracana]|uniref:CID domain-containing protein n=1 Tax=Eleusine coracana subsp. coracana TaxID=191504 RepID=A0AAV5F9G3_ELECO|nr:hypothetical protein PR202_gb19928 [Eleusine coracana subsp. coracana]
MYSHKNCYTRSRIPSLRKSASSASVESKKVQGSATELRSNGTSNLSMNTAVIFKRKRKPNRKRDPHSRDPTTPNKDEELQGELSGNLADSPNSKNEVCKSNGDEHLPLVKRARVRMGRSQVDDSPVRDTDVSDNKEEPEDQRGMHYSAAQVSNLVNTVSNPSSKFDIPFLSGEGNSSWKNKEYQPKILALDVEAALPPSKRLHRALEAMSANVAETINSLSEETGPDDTICIVQHAKRKAPESIVTNNNVPSSASVPAEAKCSGNHTMIEGTICKGYHTDRKINDCSLFCNEVGNDISGKSSAFCKAKNEPSVDVVTACIPDQLSSSLEKASENTVTKLISDKDVKPISSVACGVDKSTEPIDQTNSNVTADAIYRGETAIAESTNNVGDTTSNSSLATKSSSVLSDADTRAFEMHTFSALALKELNHRNLKDKSTSPDSMPMKELIAVAQARRFSRSTSFPDNFLNAKYIPETSVNTPPKEGSNMQLSPSIQIVRSASMNENITSRSPLGSIQQKKSIGNDEANAARRSFKDFLSTLTRTKDSIARATRLAIECAKFGIAGEAIDIIVEHLEKESNLYKRVDLFFLVDSITQCSRNQKGGAGDVYPSLIQAVLPRILYAAAPPGNSAWENRRQCLKVLKLWLERKTLSEYVIRHHIREIETINEASFGSSRRPSKTERALNDPLRDNEGMLVDEYGSNTGFQLPNLICTKVLEEEEGSSSDDRSFEAVTPEHNTPGNDDNEESQMHVEKHRHILEEVDGELEMEDVAPPSEVEVSTKCRQEQSDDSKAATSDQRPLDVGPPLPVDRPPSPPPLPSSPPPVPPHLPAPVSQSSQMQPKVQMASDPVGSHPLRATYDMEVIRIRSHLLRQWHHPILLALMGISLHPQHRTMETVTIDPQLHLYLMRDINCIRLHLHLHLRCLQISLVPCQNLNRGHIIGAIIVRLILRGPPTIPEHFEASPGPMHYGRPLDRPPGPCAGWSRPPRISNYSPSRHSMEPPVSHVAGGADAFRISGFDQPGRLQGG